MRFDSVALSLNFKKVLIMINVLSIIFFVVVIFLFSSIMYAVFCKVIQDMGESWHKGKLNAKKKFAQDLDKSAVEPKKEA